jgi:alkylation response protein AidB-like acyl-CoA dehydrogenase
VNNTAAWTKAWNDVQTLRPIVEPSRAEAERIRRLPDAVAQAFLERDVYRLMLPVEMGGAELDPLQQFDLTLEVSRTDASTGWNYSLATQAALLAGVLPPEDAREVFSTPYCGGAGSGPPQGRAVAAEGGYRVTGRWAWASGIHEARLVSGGCIVFDGDQPRPGANGGPTVIQVIVPIEQVEVLDTWLTGGMRGTGSTEFKLTDVFVPQSHAFGFFDRTPSLPHPLFRLPTSYFGFALTAVPLGVAFATVAALKDLALGKSYPPPRGRMADQASVQHTVAKTEAMVEAATLAVRDAFARIWTDVCGAGDTSLEARARLRRAMVHAVDTAIEAVATCYREAGGSAVFEAAPFERALRDVNAAGAHAVFQRGMMEDAGRVALGLPPRMAIF